MGLPGLFLDLFFLFPDMLLKLRLINLKMVNDGRKQERRRAIMNCSLTRYSEKAPSEKRLTTILNRKSQAKPAPLGQNAAALPLVLPPRP